MGKGLFELRLLRQWGTGGAGFELFVEGNGLVKLIGIHRVLGLGV